MFIDNAFIGANITFTSIAVAFIFTDNAYVVIDITSIAEDAAFPLDDNAFSRVDTTFTIMQQAQPFFRYKYPKSSIILCYLTTSAASSKRGTLRTRIHGWGRSRIESQSGSPCSQQRP